MRKILLSLVLCALAFVPDVLARAPFRDAIAFDAAVDGGNATATSLTFAVTCGGSNRFLVVAGVGDTILSGNDDITSITHGGTGMTFGVKNTASSNDRYNYIYYLIAPATGSQNVVVTAGSSHYLAFGAVCYTGAAQSAQGSNTGSNSDTIFPFDSLTSSLTTDVDNSWMVLSEGAYSGNSAPTAGTGATRRTYDATFGTWGIFDSGAAITPAGSYSMTTDRSPASTNQISHAYMQISPAGGAAPSFVPAIVNTPIRGGGLRSRR